MDRVPLRCSACNQIVGGSRLHLDGSKFIECEMSLDLHEPDCPFLASIKKDTLKGLTIESDWST